MAKLCFLFSESHFSREYLETYRKVIEKLETAPETQPNINLALYERDKQTREGS